MYCPKATGNKEYLGKKQNCTVSLIRPFNPSIQMVSYITMTLVRETYNSSILSRLGWFLLTNSVKIAD